MSTAQQLTFGIQQQLLWNVKSLTFFYQRKHMVTSSLYISTLLHRRWHITQQKTSLINKTYSQYNDYGVGVGVFFCH